MQRVGKGWQWTNPKTSLLIALSRRAYPYALAYPRAHFSVLRLTANDPQSKTTRRRRPPSHGPYNTAPTCQTAWAHSSSLSERVSAFGKIFRHAKRRRPFEILRRPQLLPAAEAVYTCKPAWACACRPLRRMIGRGFEATGRGSATGRGRSAGGLDRTAVPLCGACGPHSGIISAHFVNALRFFRAQCVNAMRCFRAQCAVKKTALRTALRAHRPHCGPIGASEVN